MTRRHVALLACLLAATSCSGPGEQAPDQTNPSPIGLISNATRTVERVIDGDTIELDGGEPVRLIGVDTPEVVDPRRGVQCFGREASNFMKEELEGQQVLLTYGTEQTDRYGRTLAYVVRERDGLSMNAELIRRGFGRAYTRFPFSRSDAFVAFEQSARDAQRGRWKLPDDEAICLQKTFPPDIAAFDDNGDFRITCAEARAHGIAPVPRTHPAYQYMRDGDGDGVVCE